MTRVRAKFRCSSVTRMAFNPDSRIYKFNPVYDPDIAEDQRYAKATPCGQLEMTVDNPDVSFELGESYYLDLTAVDDE